MKTNNKAVFRSVSISSANYIVCRICAVDEYSSSEISQMAMHHILLRLGLCALFLEPAAFCI